MKKRRGKNHLRIFFSSRIQRKVERYASQILPVRPKKNSFKTLKSIISEHLDSKIKEAAAKSLQSCPTLCDPIDGSPPGPPVPGILQARTLEWVAISFSNA